MKIKNICLLVALTFSFSGGVFASQPISRGDSDLLTKSQPYEKGRRVVVRTPSRTVVRTPTRTVVRTPARAVVRTPAVVAAPVVVTPAPVVVRPVPVVAAPVVVAPRRGVVVRPRRY